MKIFMLEEKETWSKFKISICIGSFTISFACFLIRDLFFSFIFFCLGILYLFILKNHPDDYSGICGI
jgi:hypothetical protein